MHTSLSRRGCHCHHPRRLLSSLCDPRYVDQNAALLRANLRRRRAQEQQIKTLDRVIALNSVRLELIQKNDAARADRKKKSSEIHMLMQEGKQESAEAVKQDVARISETAKNLKAELDDVEAQRDSLFLALPNYIDECVPDGDGEDQNEVMYEWWPEQRNWASGCSSSGENTAEPLEHDKLPVAVSSMHREQAARLSGARFGVLQGSLARLERALVNFFMDMHVDEHGYSEISVPEIVGEQALQGTGQLPKFEDDLFALDQTNFAINGGRAFLIPTGEVPVTNLHGGEILQEKQLPLQYVSATHCFRAEAGAAGRDTRGLIRQHQFTKVELVCITTPEHADEAHEQLTAHAENCLRLLQLPYRRVRLCSGDIGFSAKHCYDLEVWLPGAGRFREISSCSNCGEFQARRIGLRYRPASVAAADTSSEEGEQTQKKKKKKKKKKEKNKQPALEFCHTINGSGLAVGRTIAAILENYQEPNGKVAIPLALQPYMQTRREAHDGTCGSYLSE